MDSDELIRRCTERFNHTSNPSLPPDETLQAVIRLGEEKLELYRKTVELSERVSALRKELEEAYIRVKDASNREDDARKMADDIAFLAATYEECLRKIAMHECDGKEVVTAFRVYNLNKGTSGTKTINCRCYPNLDEAKAAYEKACEDMGIAFNEVNMLEWLYREVDD